MESSAQALRMAAAVMVFVIALSVAILAFSKARSTSDIVLNASDKKSQYDAFYDQDLYLTNNNSYENRIVGLETIIPSLYKYSKEDYRVIFKDGRGRYDSTTGKFNTSVIDDLPRLIIYTSKTPVDKWNLDTSDSEKIDYKASYSYKKYGSDTRISVFDISEEIQRNEPWTINTTYIKNNLDRLFKGEGDYFGNPLTKTNNKYVEYVGREKTLKNNVDPNTGEVLGSNSTTTKTVITYVLIN